MHRWLSGGIAFGALFLVGTALWLLPVRARMAHWVAGATGHLPENAVVSIAEIERDFGTVDAGGELPASFRVTNSGGRRLILLEKSRSCGCLATGRPEILVQPGQSVDLEITLKTGRLRGPIRKAVYYYTNDPKRPLLTLTMTAEVRPRPQGRSAAALH
jgi:hypothetical protein